MTYNIECRYGVKANDECILVRTNAPKEDFIDTVKNIMAVAKKRGKLEGVEAEFLRHFDNLLGNLPEEGASFLMEAHGLLRAHLKVTLTTDDGHQYVTGTYKSHKVMNTQFTGYTCELGGVGAVTCKVAYS